MACPASREPSTQIVPAAMTWLVTMHALAARTVVRRGTAVKVAQIMPVLYSLLIATTPRMAARAWPRSIPVRLSLAGSTAQPPDGQATAAAAAVLTVTV